MPYPVEAFALSFIEGYERDSHPILNRTLINLNDCLLLE